MSQRFDNPLEWEANKEPEMSTIIQLRVINFLKKWLEDFFFEDFQGKEEITSAFNSLLNKVSLSEQATIQGWKERLEEIFEEQKKSWTLKAAIWNTKIPNETDINNFIQVPVLEAARQITLIEFFAFQSTPLTEFLNVAWKKENCSPKLKSWISKSKSVKKIFPLSKNLPQFISRKIFTFQT